MTDHEFAGDGGSGDGLCRFELWTMGSVHGGEENTMQWCGLPQSAHTLTAIDRARAVKRHKFLVEKVIAEIVVNPENLDFTIEEDRLRKMLYAQVSAHFAVGCPVQIDFAIEVPANWWQHLKKALGLRHRTDVVSEHRTVYRQVCPHMPTNRGPTVECAEFLGTPLLQESPPDALAAQPT